MIALCSHCWGYPIVWVILFNNAVFLSTQPTSTSSCQPYDHIKENGRIILPSVPGQNLLSGPKKCPSETLSFVLGASLLSHLSLPMQRNINIKFIPPHATNRDKSHTSFSVDPEAETCQTPCNNHSRTSFSDGFEFYQERVSVLLLKTTETTTSCWFSLSVTSIYLSLPYHFPHFFVSVPVPNSSPFSTSFPQPSRSLTL